MFPDYKKRVPLDPKTKWGQAKFTNFPKNKVSIWCWNVNGVCPKLENKKLLNFINEKEPDVLCILETKVGSDKIIKSKIWKEFP